mmetsp:Transcript_8872/g.10278  ORF Transcript_8872/g.10278 Transcript_8872/m.10278 type:complete len:109 (+) Transcript_8872:648-974(+)
MLVLEVLERYRYQVYARGQNVWQSVLMWKAALCIVSTWTCHMQIMLGLSHMGMEHADLDTRRDDTGLADMPDMLCHFYAYFDTICLSPLAGAPSYHSTVGFYWPTTTM